MFSKWMPWKTIVRYLARRHGFIDPIKLLASLDHLAQPSEIDIPIELLRAGVVFHARGLINSKVIQQNLDWKWPYWVVRQFDPRNDAFLPRGFNITHVNLTHRNWTAVGLPDYPLTPIVDPCGMVTPFYDGWSLEGWIVSADPDAKPGLALIPAETVDVAQRLGIAEDGPSVITELRKGPFSLSQSVQATDGPEGPECRVRFEPRSEEPAVFVVAVRPMNPEGISQVQRLEAGRGGTSWKVDDREAFACAPAPMRVVMSDYHDGDVFTDLLTRPEATRSDCRAGLASGAALYALRPGEALTVDVTTLLENDPENGSFPAPSGPRLSWRDAMASAAALEAPDARIQTLYDAALRTLVLHSPLEVYPGPYTYKRFWFRDAALILHALLFAGFVDRVERCLAIFPAKQQYNGFFHSQDGEWDSNGQVLWLADLFTRISGRALGGEWRKAVSRGAEWLIKKRVRNAPDALHDGLLPAGFSAEHFGNNDYYYWDDFWGVAGLGGAASLCERWGQEHDAERFRAEAIDFMAAIERSLINSASRRRRIGLPASPYRRLDSGAVGSLAAGYPLRLLPSSDPRLLDTAHFLSECCTVHGGFFQDMIHSGMNAYLTLHMAQVLLRAGEPEFYALVETIAGLASPTGQWPEAIHPRTLGGCMGDGQHAWAAAEWVMMIRNMFVREEGDALVLASGVPESWLDAGKTMRFGPTPTPYGPVTVHVVPQGDTVHVAWEAQWRGQAPALDIRLGGRDGVTVDAAGTHSVDVSRVRGGAET